MTATGVNGDWSIKDVLVHLTAWQQRLLAELQKAGRGDKADMCGVDINGEEMDRLNEQFYQENKNRPLNEVLNDFYSTHTSMLAAVQAMSSEDLTLAYSSEARRTFRTPNRPRCSPPRSLGDSYIRQASQTLS